MVFGLLLTHSNSYYTSLALRALQAHVAAGSGPGNISLNIQTGIKQGYTADPTAELANVRRSQDRRDAVVAQA